MSAEWVAVLLLVGALLLIGGAYWRALRAAAVVRGRHRLSRSHPGWETAIEDLYALRRVRGRR